MRHWARTGTTSSWRRSSAWTCAAPTGRTGACAGPAATSAGPSRRSLRRLRHRLHRPVPAAQPRPASPRSRRPSPRCDELVLEGKVRYIGSSNLTGWQVVDADWTAKAGGYERFVSAQNKYSLLDRDVEDELVPACEHVGVGILPFFPLEFGLLTGKYRRGEEAPEGTRLAHGRRSRLDSADWDRIEALEAFAAERGLSMLHVAIGGLAAQPAVASVIAGVTTRGAGPGQRRGRTVGADGPGPRRASTRSPARSDRRPGCPVPSRGSPAGRPVSAEAGAGVIFAAAPRGCGAAGSAPRSQRGGQGFESPQLHPRSEALPRKRGRASDVGPAGCRAQAVPAAPEAAARVLTAYLKALRAGDCHTARLLGTSTFVPGNGELGGHLTVKANTPLEHPPSPATAR